MRIGITSHEIETMIVAGSESRLQSVVGRTVEIREVVNFAEVWKLGKRKNRISRVRSRLIEISDAGKFYTMVANVGDIECKLGGERMLDTQSPVFNVGSPEIAVHGEGVARVRRATRN